MRYFSLAALLFSGSVSAVSGRALADAFSYVKNPATVLVSRNITPATAPQSVVLRNQHEVGVLAHSRTYRFAQTIRIEGIADPTADSRLMNRFLGILPNMQRIRHIEIHNITFDLGQLRQLIQILNGLTYLESLNLNLVQGLNTGDLEQLRSASLRQLTLDSLGPLIITINFNCLLQNLRLLQDLILRRNIQLPQLSGSESPNYTNRRVLRLWLINQLLQEGNRPLEAALISHIRTLTREELLEPIGPNEIPLIQLLNLRGLATTDILALAIGDGQDPRLHQQDREGNTLAMRMSFEDRLSDSLDNAQLLGILIGDGTRPELHQPNRDNYTLAMILAFAYRIERVHQTEAHKEAYKELILEYLNRLIRNAPPESLAFFTLRGRFLIRRRNLATYVFENVVLRPPVNDLRTGRGPEIELFELLVGDGSRRALHEPGPGDRTLAALIACSLNEHPVIAARFLFPLLRYRHLVDNATQIRENDSLAQFLRRNFDRFTTEQQTTVPELLVRLIPSAGAS